MSKYVKVRIASDGDISAEGVSTPAAERLWYEVMHPTTSGYHCKLNSTPVSVEAPEYLDVTNDMILEELEGGDAGNDL